MKFAGKKRPCVSLFNDSTFILILIGLAALLGVLYSFASPAPQLQIVKNTDLSKKINSAAQAKIAANKKDTLKKKSIKYKKLSFRRNYPFNQKKPNFVLKTEKNLGASEVDMSNLSKAWSGENDLSVRAWLGVDKDLLKFTAVVTDDVGMFGDIPNEMWNFDSIQLAIAGEKIKPQFEFGFGLDSKGRKMRAIWLMPAKYEKTKQSILNSIDFNITRNNEHTLVYEIRIPYAELGLTRQDLARGIRFSFIVNDIDKKGDTRCWMELSPGIGQDKWWEYFPHIKLP